MTGTKRIAILHGAGYVGGELIRLLLAHPHCQLVAVTSRTFAGRPLWHAHPALRGQTELTFVEEDALALSELDAVLIAAEHGQGARTVQHLLESGYPGVIIDLSADFRFREAAVYPAWFGFDHPAPELLGRFVYGLPEVYAPYAADTRLLANPGCFATGLALALWPLSRHLKDATVAVTALTGASGSGVKPKATTHFPERDGNVRAYKVLAHQHLPEVQQVVGTGLHIAFVPASGPWTRGIWGTVHVALPDGIGADEVASWYEAAYGQAPFVRLWPDQLPELRYAVHTPFCDLGWIVRDGHLVVGFALDNLLKGAASQAVQNLNLLLGLPQTAGLLPTPAPADVHA
ncbi:N-acetyl-gamma-glutamyl-phosphate reductase [Rhodothermus marinus]|uniref:N-acetyl-gamma-glutamyl-phosphate reductase n=1 Tax=Rhodothermus marinus (strain ATCC 43812 / DSM 4252 / R-10) TaxID=518766 RepID=D0MH57_RHOM4|nr:N-acetyl-gamma-glutamyl-phosphate reductase [Rhodothermus marinus]ACY47842.1 N-acetyl-gamma-glutamyl-phosphate reductase [Rhodothermus marinus DSM 4252]